MCCSDAHSLLLQLQLQQPVAKKMNRSNVAFMRQQCLLAAASASPTLQDASVVIAQEK